MKEPKENITGICFARAVERHAILDAKRLWGTPLYLTIFGKRCYSRC